MFEIEVGYLLLCSVTLMRSWECMRIMEGLWGGDRLMLFAQLWRTVSVETWAIGVIYTLSNVEILWKRWFVKDWIDLLRITVGVICFHMQR